MRVDDPNLRQVSTSETGGASNVERVTSGRSSARAGAASEVRDEAEISTLGSALRGVQESSPARTQKVEQLRAIYQTGNYQPDVSAVARGLLNEGVESGSAAKQAGVSAPSGSER